MIDTTKEEKNLQEIIGDLTGKIRALGALRPGLLQHALKIFSIHSPLAREYFPLGSLEQRQPYLVLPSSVSIPAIARLTAEYYADQEAPPAGSSGDENKLDFWREDPLLNEHHEHWHLVYPDGDGNRSGELFAYMHQQMLARYDAERLAVKLARVLPFNQYKN